MASLVERSLESILTAPFCFGQLLVRRIMNGGFIVSHRDEASLDQLQTYRDAQDAVEIAKYDDEENYRPLKTAPNLRHGWRLELANVEELQRALDYFYPGRLPLFEAWKSGYLRITPLRDTLDRQSGMYRVAAKISDRQVNHLVADFCQSDNGCLRTILWERDRNGVIASTKLPKEKFDPGIDQATFSARPGSAISPTAAAATSVPLLCQEACNLLVNECRKVVKGESA
jgi:sirohydrochlorin cobaltochelatase